MQKNFRYYYLKFMSVILLTVGMLVGFTTKIIAQYGAPMVNFLFKGRVYSEANQKPLPNMYIQPESMIPYGKDSSSYNNITNNKGSFNILGITDWDKNVQVFIEDIDGDTNGRYISYYKTLNLSNDKDVDIYMKKEKTIAEIVAENELPTTLNNRKINYIDIVYLTQFYSLNIATSNYGYDATAYLNGNIISKNQVFDDNSTFIIDSNDSVNYVIIENGNKSISHISYNLTFTNPYSAKKIVLKQSATEIDAVIIKLITPE